MTAFERYGVKNAKKPIYAAYSFREGLNRAQWRDVIERCRVQRSTPAVRALAAVSGGSAGRCGYIRTFKSGKAVGYTMPLLQIYNKDQSHTYSHCMHMLSFYTRLLWIQESATMLI